jgi:hypothetical protein
MPRHLLSGDDYASRPGSSYKMNSIHGQAMDEFTSAINPIMGSTMNSINSNNTNNVQIMRFQ